jgi:hypothetical protein
MPQWKVRDILKLLLSKSTARARPGVFKGNPTIEVCKANGSFESILQWANAVGLDARQKRSFESSRLFAYVS